MADITAAVVNEFRKRTGLGLMECKAILKEADGDLKRAEILAKERGLKNVEKRSGRGTNAGRIEAAFNADRTSGALIELNCETDFVARNDDFRAATKQLAEHILAVGDSGNAPDTALTGDTSKTIKDFLTDLGARTGENVTFSRASRFQNVGRVEVYIHHDGKSGAMVAVNGTAPAEVLSTLAKDLALQVVAAKPLALGRDELPADAVEEQKQIYIKQAEDKPENIREKIALGKLESWFAENALVDQLFVKDASKKVRDVIAAAGKDVSVVSFARFVVGEIAEGA
jgi:elongation factor Ts